MGPTSREQFTRPGKGLLWPQCLNKGDGRHRRGWVQCVPVATKDGDPGRLMPTTKAGDGDMECHLSGGEEVSASVGG